MYSLLLFFVWFAQAVPLTPIPNAQLEQNPGMETNGSFHWDRQLLLLDGYSKEGRNLYRADGQRQLALGAERGPVLRSADFSFALALSSTVAAYSVLTCAAILNGATSQGLSPLVIAGIVGVVVGPSAGHLYSQDWLRGASSAGARLLSVLALFAGSQIGGIIAGVGVAGFLAVTVLDIVDAPRSPRRVYQRQMRKWNVSVAPAIDSHFEGLGAETKRVTGVLVSLSASI